MKILFLCIENAGRSQMAEGFAKKFSPPGIEIFSAGSRPAQALDSVAVEVMGERGIDIRAQVPKGLEALPAETFDLVVGMGCGDVCPTHRSRRTILLEIPNPKGQPIEAVRSIRDEIERNVRSLLSGLGESSRDNPS